MTAAQPGRIVPLTQVGAVVDSLFKDTLGTLTHFSIEKFAFFAPEHRRDRALLRQVLLVQRTGP